LKYNGKKAYYFRVANIQNLLVECILFSHEVKSGYEI